MKLASIAYGLIGLALAACALEWHGHHRGFADGVQAAQADADRKVEAAQADTRQARAERDANAQSLVNIQQQLKAKKAELDTARFIAQAALDARDGLQKKLDELTAQREAEVKKAAHDDPQCTDLARLPVCPAVAERLWGKAASGTAAQGH